MNLKEIIELLKESLALTSVNSIFDNDAHRIVSKKGWKIINSKKL